MIKKDKYTLLAALYKLDNDEKDNLCKFLYGVKMPDGVSSNIRCVDLKACQVSGLKSHDYHLILHKLLPLVVWRILPQQVVVVLIQLSNFSDALCSKELGEADLDKLSTTIVDTLCRLKMIFPPSFFDIMMHFPIHLAKESKLRGVVCYRWMYLVERYLHTAKGYVRNKAHPEGSIAKGYILEECLTFCSRFMDMDTKLNRADRHESVAVNEPPSGQSLFAAMDYNRRGQTAKLLDKDEMRKIKHYIISNYDDAKPFIE